MCQHIVRKAVEQSSQGLACFGECKNGTNSMYSKLIINFKTIFAFTLLLATLPLEMYSKAIPAHKQNIGILLHV